MRRSCAIPALFIADTRQFVADTRQFVADTHVARSLNLSQLGRKTPPKHHTSSHEERGLATRGEVVLLTSRGGLPHEQRGLATRAEVVSLTRRD